MIAIGHGSKTTIIILQDPNCNCTVELVNENETLSEYFTTILGVTKLSNRVSSNNKSRKLLAELIALVSGAVWGSEYTNCKYFTHVPILTGNYK